MATWTNRVWAGKQPTPAAPKDAGKCMLLAVEERGNLAFVNYIVQMYAFAPVLPLYSKNVKGKKRKSHK